MPPAPWASGRALLSSFPRARRPGPRPTGPLVPTRPTDSQPAPAGAPAGARKKLASAADSRIAVAAALTSESSRGPSSATAEGHGSAGLPGQPTGRPSSCGCGYARRLRDGVRAARRRAPASGRTMLTRRTGPRCGLGNASGRRYRGGNLPGCARARCPHSSRARKALRRPPPPPPENCRRPQPGLGCGKSSRGPL